jgi:sugar/nucleoside kinase (ribokinase family)
MRLVSVGECTIDRYLDLGIEAIGGISLNFAVSALRSGASAAALVTCTGDDAGAAQVRAVLQQVGVDTTHIHTLPGPTGSQAIHMAEGGERIFPPGGYDAGVLRDFRLNDDDLRFIQGFDIIAAPYFRQIAHIFRAAMLDTASQARRVADLLDGSVLGADLSGIDELLDALDIIFISAGPALIDQLEHRSQSTRTLIVVTHGAEGSTTLARGERFFQPAIAVPKLVDTTGCGDAYQGAFTMEYFRSAAIPAALRAGAEQAARVIQHYGAYPEAVIGAGSR